MSHQEISVRTRSRSELLDITSQLSRLVQESKVADGLMVVFREELNGLLARLGVGSSREF